MFGQSSFAHMTEEKLMFAFSLMYSEGVSDVSKDNHNELVNPGESVFKWTTIADYAKKTNGKPTDLPSW